MSVPGSKTVGGEVKPELGLLGRAAKNEASNKSLRGQRTGSWSRRVPKGGRFD